MLDVTKYMDKHPGGAEILMEFAGKNADDMFEDIGHSTEARDAMVELVIGTVTGDAGAETKAKKTPGAEVTSKGGLNPLAIFALLIAILVGFYFSQQK